MFYIAIKSTYLGHSRTPQKGTAMAFTITTFNILAAVHRSMDTKNSRESERREWWQPRAENLGHFIVKELVSLSDRHLTCYKVRTDLYLCFTLLFQGFLRCCFTTRVVVSKRI